MKKENTTQAVTDKKNKAKRSYGKIIFRLWLAFFAFVCICFLPFFLIAFGFIGYIPDDSELANPKNKYASQLFSSDGVLLANFNEAGANRVYVPYEKLPSYLVKALVDTEDRRFYTHSGIDFRSLWRVAFKTVLTANTSGGGGSTISQQTAKLFYSERPQSKIKRIFQKLNEWVIAVKLERAFTKEEIVTLYFNRLDFSHNAVGIEMASKVYFNCKPEELTIEQAATLVGMCKNPSIFNPKSRPEQSLKRREVVLKQMLIANDLTEQEYDSLRVLPMGMKYRAVDHKSGLAPYLRSYIRTSMSSAKPDIKNYNRWQKSAFVRDSIRWIKDPLYGWCNKNRKPDGTPYNLYTDGLRIYSTIDSRMQKHAEEAVSEHMSSLQADFFKEKKGHTYAPYPYGTTAQEKNDYIKRAMMQTDHYRSLHDAGVSLDSIIKIFKTPTEMSLFSWDGLVDTTMTPWDSLIYYKHILRSSFVSEDPKTGYIKAYVGGIDFNHFQYDMVTLGKRQVGSTFKPIVYTLAMQNGYTPCTEVADVPYSLKDGSGNYWSPRNAHDKREGQMVTLKWGLANSNNNITAWVMSKLTPEAVVSMAHSMGISTKLDTVVSICLGPVEISLSEMVSTYSVYAAKGLYADPIVVFQIEDSNGNLISRIDPNRKEVISANTSYLMLDMLKGVTKIGTGIRTRLKYKLKGEFGGKTGTTQDNSDGWFIGVTPRLVSGAWVGGEERTIHFAGTYKGQGANTGLPIWAIYMQKIYADSALGYNDDEVFEKPYNFNVNLDCDTQTDSVAIDEHFF